MKPVRLSDLDTINTLARLRERLLNAPKLMAKSVEQAPGIGTALRAIDDELRKRGVRL